MNKRRISGYLMGLEERRKRTKQYLKDISENNSEASSAIGQDQKSKLMSAFMSTPLPMASAGIGGVLIENVIGKTPSFIFGAFATYMGYLTGLKPLSALGLGMVTASYYSHRLENPHKQSEEKVEGIFQTRAEYKELNAPSEDMFLNPEEESVFNDDLSPAEDETTELGEEKNTWGNTVNSKNLLGYFRTKPSSKRDLDEEDITEKLY